MGLGLLGRGLNDAIFLAKCGAILTITDLKDEKALERSLEQLKKFKGITYTLGKHDTKDFEDKDFILKAAGVPLESVFIKHAINKNIPVEMDASLFAKLAEKVATIGVTGTRGKTTTTHLIYEFLKASLKGKTKKVYLGGNIQGLATLPLLSKVKKGDYVVLELDSWQLQGFGDSKISPHIGVFTNFLDDHLNYYQGNKDKYFEDKSNIFKFQSDKDFLVTGSKVPDIKTKSKKIKAFSNDIPADYKFNLVGEHNRENIAAALKVVEILKIPKKVIKDVLKNFKAVSGRLEKIRDYKGISIWNDTTATTPDATLEALKSFKNGVVLIMGGSDKGLDISRLISEIPKYTKKIVVLPGTGSEKLLALSSKLQAKIVEVETLEEAVKIGLENCESGDVLLFSPAFASFGMFKNEYDRGEQFVKEVQNL